MPALQFSLGIECEQSWHTVGRGRGIAKITAYRGLVLYLPPTDFGSRLGQRFEPRWQHRLAKRHPGFQGANAPPRAAVNARHARLASQSIDSAQIEDRARDGPADMRRVNIGAARQRQPSRLGQQAERVVKPLW